MAGSLSAARAEERACAALDAPTFRSALEATRKFIDAEDLAGYKLASRVVTERIPCLSFVPDPEDWASFLVDRAAVAYFQGEDWQRPLATALTLVPHIDRGVGPEHEIALFVPPPRAPGTGAVPDGVELYVDGVRAFEIPAAQGLHLVQARAGRGPLRSALLVDEPVPPELLSRKERTSAAPTPARPGPGPERRAALGGYLGLAGGLGRTSQRALDPADDLPSADRMALMGAVAGQVWFGRPLGATIELLATARPDVSLLLHRQGGPLTVGLGAAFLQPLYFAEGETRSRPVLSPAGLLALRSRSVDGSVQLAAGPAAYARGLLQLGISAGAEERGPRLRAGLVGRAIAARFVQDGTGRSVSSTDWAALLQLGLAWGSP